MTEDELVTLLRQAFSGANPDWVNLASKLEIEPQDKVSETHYGIVVEYLTEYFNKIGGWEYWETSDIIFRNQTKLNDFFSGDLYFSLEKMNIVKRKNTYEYLEYERNIRILDRASQLFRGVVSWQLQDNYSNSTVCLPAGVKKDSLDLILLVAHYQTGNTFNKYETSKPFRIVSGRNSLVNLVNGLKHRGVDINNMNGVDEKDPHYHLCVDLKLRYSLPWEGYFDTLNRFQILQCLDDDAIEKLDSPALCDMNDED